MIDIKITEDNIQLKNSYTIKKSWMMSLLLDDLKMKSEGTSKVFDERSKFSLISEWRAHNLLYSLHYKRERTKDVDLDINETKLRKICYVILGSIYFLFHF